MLTWSTPSVRKLQKLAITYFISVSLQIRCGSTMLLRKFSITYDALLAKPHLDNNDNYGTYKFPCYNPHNLLAEFVN